MKYVPREYQQIVTDRIINSNKFMAVLDMGLGKTVSTLTAIEQLLDDYFDASQVLIIAPKRVALFTWPEELNKWDHLKNLSYSVMVGTETERIKAFKEHSQISIINVDNVKWLIDYCISLKTWPFDTIVVDESSLFKNHSSLRFKALARVSRLAKRVILLTGTPTSNGLHDLWSQIYLLDQGKRLGKNISSYRRSYFQYIPYRYEYKLLPNAKKRFTIESLIYHLAWNHAITSNFQKG